MFRDPAHRPRRIVLACLASAALAATLTSAPASTAESARDQAPPYRDASLSVD